MFEIRIKMKGGEGLMRVPYKILHDMLGCTIPDCLEHKNKIDFALSSLLAELKKRWPKECKITDGYICRWEEEGNREGIAYNHALKDCYQILKDFLKGGGDNA